MVEYICRCGAYLELETAIILPNSTRRCPDCLEWEMRPIKLDNVPTPDLNEEQRV